MSGGYSPLVLMDEAGELRGGDREILSVTFDHPLVVQHKITVEASAISSLSPEQAQQLLTSLQEDSEQE